MENNEKKIRVFKRVNTIIAWIAQSRFRFLSKPISHILAKGTLKNNKGTKKDTIEEIAKEWQRVFSLDEYFKIAQVLDEEVICEIHFECALERSGNIEACHRLMEYDRTIVKEIGGELTVLQSRVDPNVKGPCMVAIRAKGSL